MKFTCERSILLKEIAIAQESIASKNAISILSNIYLEAKDGQLTIKATDLKVTFETSVPVDVQEEGSTTVFGEKFLGSISNLPEGEMEFVQKDNNTVVKPSAAATKKIKYTLKCIASEKYPEFPAKDKAASFEMPIKDFKSMVQQTVFAVSDDETRYFMNGVFFKKEGEKVVMVSTDGRRLAYAEKTSPEGVEDFAGIIIPPKVLHILVKHAGDEGLIGISINDKNIFINFASYSFSSVLIDGQFPNYQRVIPEDQKYVFTVDRQETLDALKSVSLMVEKSRRIYLHVSPGQMSVTSEESDMGDADRIIPCKYEGEEIALALNYSYLEEPFKVMAEDEASIHFTETNRAVTIKPVPEKDFFHVVMPMSTD
jgi:DNA polymerase-3 subunit beta